MQPLDCAEQVLVRLVDAYPAVDHSREHDKTIHVSNLIEFCPREYYLCQKNGRNFHQRMYLGVSTGYTFDLGHKIQEIQAERLASAEMIYGTWKCLHCGAKELRFFKKNHKCRKCKSRAWKYVDTSFLKKIGSLIITASVDLLVLVRLAPAILAITDSKSIKAEEFDRLATPEIKYQRQVELYLWMAKTGILNPKAKVVDALPEICLENGVLSYACKGSRAIPFKTFNVPYNEPFVSETERKLISLSEGLASNTEPQAICGTVHAMMAKRCAVRDICFGYGAGGPLDPPQMERPVVDAVEAPGPERTTPVARGPIRRANPKFSGGTDE